jgi:hypothetical protein
VEDYVNARTGERFAELSAAHDAAEPGDVLWHNGGPALYVRDAEWLDVIVP